MSPSPRFTLLRRALVADAAISGAFAVLMLSAATPLAGLLGLPAALLRGAGVALLPFVALVTRLALRDAPPRAAVHVVIVLNVAWVIASAFLAFGSIVSPNPLGYAFIGAQAFTVAVFADLQYMGMRRAMPPQAA